MALPGISRFLKPKSYLRSMNVLEHFKPIRLFAFDMDGVLTDGSLLVMPDGEWVRKMNIRDGYALQLAIKLGYDVAIITGSISNPIADRLRKLGITHVFQNVVDKSASLRGLMAAKGLIPEQVLFMGDDMPDVPALAVVGLPVCPSDAAEDVQAVCRYISPLRGGEGCVRDVIEKTLRIQGNWGHELGLRSI